MKKVISLLAVLTLMVGTTQAAEITWGEVFNITSVEDLAAGGDILYALNLGESDVPVVDVTNSRETISFEAFVVDGVGNASGNYFTVEGGTAGDDNLNKILDSHTYTANVLPFVLTDLTVGQAYQLQFIAAADTRGCCSDRIQALDDGMGNISGDMLRSGPGSVLGIFTADDDIQAVSIVGAADPGSSAIILRAVPEPSTFVMLVAALVGLVCARRRRR